MSSPTLFPAKPTRHPSAVPGAPPVTPVKDVCPIVGLGASAGKVNWNLFAMTREGLRTDLHRCFTKAMAQPGLASAPGLCLEEGGIQHFVDLGVEKLTGPASLEGMLMVLFRSAAPPKPRKALSKVKKCNAASLQLEDLETDLAEARQELRKDQEQMQSLNEELQTVNAELLGKLDQNAQEKKVRKQKDAS